MKQSQIRNKMENKRRYTDNCRRYRYINSIYYLFTKKINYDIQRKYFKRRETRNPLKPLKAPWRGIELENALVNQISYSLTLMLQHMQIIWFKKKFFNLYCIPLPNSNGSIKRFQLLMNLIFQTFIGWIWDSRTPANCIVSHTVHWKGRGNVSCLSSRSHFDLTLR